MALPKLKCQQCGGTGEVGAGRDKKNCSNCGGEGEISR